MGRKITFIGAGSFGFTYKLVSDILNKQELTDSTFCFMDIDVKRLENLKILLDVHFAKVGYTMQASYTQDMTAALTKADFVFNVTKIGCYEASVEDMEIPKKYGLYQTIGDTCGVAGVSRGLRTMLFIDTLLQTMEQVSSPGAVVLNYTNPQPMSVMFASRVSKIPFIGLCHSVQGTTRQMASALDIPYDEVVFEAGGINHLSFITKFTRDGNDLYPLLRAKSPELFERQYTDDDHLMADLGQARIDLLNRVGYMVTESSQHLCEYVPFYLRSPEMVESLHVKHDLYKRNIANSTKRFANLVEDAKLGKLELPDSSVEYGPEIIYAMVTNKPCKIYANVMNEGLIDNLPTDSCVEVACLVDSGGVQPCHYGKLPLQLAMLCAQELQVHKLAVEAAVCRDSRYVYWALLADPVANGILNPNQIRDLTVEVIQAQQAFLPGFSVNEIQGDAVAM